MSPVESQKSVILLWDTFHSIIFIAWCVLGLPMCAILMMLNFTCHKWMTPISVKYFLWGPSTLDWYCCGRIICSYVFTYLQPFTVFICFSFFCVCPVEQVVSLPAVVLFTFWWWQICSWLILKPAIQRNWLAAGLCSLSMRH